MESYRVIDQEAMLEGLDPMAHNIWQKPMKGIISFDVGEGKDYSVTTLFENGEYHPIAVCDSISFGGNVEHSGYVSTNVLSDAVERLRLSFERLSWRIEEGRILMCKVASLSRGKVRKTTYRTIRRDCAKRNRYK